MKKGIIGFLFALLASHQGQGQNIYGPELGINISNYSYKYDGIAEVKGTSRKSLRLGLTVDNMLKKNWSLEYGVFYAGNGTSISQRKGTRTQIFEPKVNTLQVPVAIKYQYPLSKTELLTASVGLFAAYNVTGKYFVTDTTGIKASDNINFGSGANAGMHQFDAGLHATAGILFKSNFFARVTYQTGFTNLSPISYLKIHNTAVAITAGYYFKDNGRRPDRKKKRNNPKKEEAPTQTPAADDK